MSETTTTVSSTTSPAPVAAFYKKWWIDNRERLSEWYRLYFHTVAVTILMVFNLFLGYSGLIVFLSHWQHKVGSPAAALSLLYDHPPEWLLILMNLFYVQLDTSVLWMLIAFNLPLITWVYSTITQPIKKGYKVIISWRSEKGRKVALVLSAVPFVFMYWAIGGWYIDKYMFNYLAGIAAPDKKFLVVQSMSSLGYILMVLPVFVTIVGTYLVVKQFYMFEDLQKQFMTWELPLFARQSFSLKNNRADVIVGWDKNTHKPIVVPESSRYLHLMSVGTTGTGKTSTSILIQVVQDLIRIARGQQVSVVCLEPKGDLVQDIIKLAKQLGIPDSKILVVDPTDLVRSIKFNPFAGPMESAGEAFRGVLDSLTPDQDDFFKGQQGETAVMYTYLGKLRYGNLFNIVHLQKMYTDARFLADMTEQVRGSLDQKKADPNVGDEEKKILERYERIVSYFEDEILEYKTLRDRDGRAVPTLYPDAHRYAGRQVVANKKDGYVSGAKKYVNDLAMNTMLSQLMITSADDRVLDIDNFLRDGGILLVNSALGTLEELSLIFGQFFIRQFQSSVFRRPPEEELKRNPTFFYVDEFALYANPAFERMLTLGRSYKVGTLIAFQSLGQLKKVERGYDETIKATARNKIVFGGGQKEDNEWFSEHFGEEYEIEESLNESTTPVTMPNQSWGYRYNTQRKLAARFSPTDIKELPFKNFVVEVVSEEGSIQPPIQAYGKFVTETKFIKKFVDIGKVQLATAKHKALSVGDHLNYYKGLITASLFSEAGSPDEQEKVVVATEKTDQESEPNEAVKVVDVVPTTTSEQASDTPDTDTSDDNSVAAPEKPQTDVLADSKPAGVVSDLQSEMDDAGQPGSVTGAAGQHDDDDDLSWAMDVLPTDTALEDDLVDQPVPDITVQTSVLPDELSKQVDELLDAVAFGAPVQPDINHEDQITATASEVAMTEEPAGDWSLDDLMDLPEQGDNKQDSPSSNTDKLKIEQDEV